MRQKGGRIDHQNYEDPFMNLKDSIEVKEDNLPF